MHGMGKKTLLGRCANADTRPFFERPSPNHEKEVWHVDILLRGPPKQPTAKNTTNGVKKKGCNIRLTKSAETGEQQEMRCGETLW